jgi:hypothetical protein
MYLIQVVKSNRDGHNSSGRISNRIYSVLSVRYGMKAIVCERPGLVSCRISDGISVSTHLERIVRVYSRLRRLFPRDDQHRSEIELSCYLV